MSRDIGSAFTAAVEAANVPLIAFVELDFGSGAVRVTNAPYTFSWNGHDWLGLGTLGSIEPIEEGAGLEARGVGLRLAGVPVSNDEHPEMIGIALDEHYQGRDCRIWVAVLDDQYRIIGDPKLIFLGRMDHMDITVGDVGSILLHAESRLADLERPRVRRYNDADQQAEYAGDLGLQFAEQMVEFAILWGRV